MQHYLRHFKDAPHRQGTGRWRLVFTAAACAAGFAVGALYPTTRMLVGSTTALLAVAVVQLAFILASSKNTAKPPKGESSATKEPSSPPGAS